MAERLKRWESPRRQGRNDKGRGGSARQRQLRKQQQMLRKKLKPDSDHKKQIREKEDKLNYLPFIFFRGKSGFFLPAQRRKGERKKL